MLEENFSEDKDQGVILKAVLFKYIRYWFWFVAGVSIALIIAYLYMRYSPKTYASVAKINILDSDEGLELSGAMYLWNQSTIKLEREMEILKSYPLLKKVVNNQELTVQYFEVGDIQTSEISQLPFDFIKSIDNDSITHTFGFEIRVLPNDFEVQQLGTEDIQKFKNHSSIGTTHELPFELNPLEKEISPEVIDRTYTVYFKPIESAISNLKGQIQVTPLGEDTDLLQISYLSESYEKNERVLNELINVFNKDGIDDRRAVSQRTYEFIDQRFITLAEELDSLETDIQDFKQENKIITIESKAGAGMENLSATEERLFELENQLNLLDIIESSLTSSGDNVNLLPANIGVSSQNINQLVNDYNQLVLEYLNLENSATKNNPLLLNLKSSINNLNKNIFASLKSSKNQLNATKKQVERKNRNLTDQIFDIPAKEKFFLDIKRQQEIKQELYLYLLQKREEAVINYAITEPSIKVVEPAISSKVPVSPQPQIAYGAAVLLGLGVPFIVLYIIFLLDTKVRNRESIEKLTKKVPFLAELPLVKKEKHLSFLVENDNSVQAEAFRVLTYNLKYILTSGAQDQKGKVVYCTSTIKGEGKTHISLNIALALSSLNHKVLLIGADLRNPQIHNFIDKDKNLDGLSKYLHDLDYDWHEGLLKNFVIHPKFHILLAGSTPPNPSKLLTSPRLKQILDEAKEEYDYIIVDTAPTLLVSDTLLMSSLADATVYASRANYTEKRLLEFSMNLSETGKLVNMAYVVNALNLKKSNSYGYGYGYSYGYNYGYSYGYNNDTKKKKK